MRSMLSICSQTPGPSRLSLLFRKWITSVFFCGMWITSVWCPLLQTGTLDRPPHYLSQRVGSSGKECSELNISLGTPIPWSIYSIFFKRNYATLKFDLPATISLRALLLGTQGCRGVLLVDMWGRTSDCTVLKLKRQGKKAKASAFHSHVWLVIPPTTRRTVAVVTPLWVVAGIRTGCVTTVYEIICSRCRSGEMTHRFYT
jgi:hypothetical protein